MYPKLLKIKKISNVIILLCEWFFNGLFINCHQKETIHYYIILITSRPKAGKPAEATQQAAASKRKTRAKAELQIKIFTATQQYRLCDTSAQGSASPPHNTSQSQHVNIMLSWLLFRPVTGCYIGVLSSQLPIKIPTVQYCFKHSTCPNRHG